MAKTPRKNARKARQAAAQAGETPMSRRVFLRRVQIGGLAALGLGGAGYAGAGWYRGFVAEHDLARIGQGKPAVVQVHDPTCSTCTALQREARHALAQFGECDLIYLVADIKQDAGAAFAAVHNVPNVTLVLFDGEGQVQQVLSGMRSRAELRGVFAGHFEAYGAGV